MKHRVNKRKSVNAFNRGARQTHYKNTLNAGRGGIRY